MTARTNARNGNDVRSARYPAATTVTVHSREATSEPSDTVTFTTCAPGVVDAISRTPTDNDDRPRTKVTIRKASLLP